MIDDFEPAKRNELSATDKAGWLDMQDERFTETEKPWPKMDRSLESVTGKQGAVKNGPTLFGGELTTESA